MSLIISNDNGKSNCHEIKSLVTIGILKITNSTKEMAFSGVISFLLSYLLHLRILVDYDYISEG